MNGSQDEPPLVRVLGKLEAEGFRPKRGSGDKWSAHCPGHHDRQASLSLEEGSDGRALLHCHAGCEIEAVLRPLGLSTRALFPAGSRQRISGPQRRQRNLRTPAGPYDETFGIVPACILENADTMCIALSGYLALRCGKDNRPQRGWEPIARALSVDSRTLRRHGEYLAGLGWIHIHAETTATGAHKAVKIWLAHCPPLKITGQNVRTPNSNHAKSKGRNVVQPMHRHAGDPATTVAGQIECDGTSIANSEPDCGTTVAPRSRYVEVVDTSVLNTSRAKVLSDAEAISLVLSVFPGAYVILEQSA